MKRELYKYVVTVDTTAWDNSIEEAIEDKSTFERIEITDTDPLAARKKALQKAKSIEDFFEDASQPHNLPPIKWMETFSDSEPMLWMFYQIKVDFENNGESLCIFNTGEMVEYEDELLDGLQKEYQILKRKGFNLKADAQIVKYYDCKDKRKKQASILGNGMEWVDTKINIIHSIDFDPLEEKKKVKKKQARKKLSKKNIQDEKVFQSTYKHRFNVNSGIVEISCKTSSQMLAVELEKDLNMLIQKWMKAK